MKKTALFARIAKVCPPGLAVMAAGIGFLPLTLTAQTMTITVNVDVSQRGAAYPATFPGLGFEQGEMKPNNGVTGFVLDTNTTRSPKCNQVINLCQNMGLKHIRIGGGSVEMNKFYNGQGFTVPTGYDYDQTGVDALFAFATQVGAKVIFSTRLQGTTTYDGQTDAVNCAKYAWNTYQSQIDALSIGNEPNYHSYHTYTGHTVDPKIYETNTTPQAPGSAYPSYVHNQAGNPVDGLAGKWKVFASAITTGAVGTPVFAGPDTGDEQTSTTTWWNNGTKNVSWTQAFVEDRKSGNIAVPVTTGLTHWYIGASNPTQGDVITQMLSSAWVTTNYPQEYNLITKPVSLAGWNYRFSEVNEFLGDVDSLCQSYAPALWALDFMHWQAANDPRCVGVNFHNKFGIFTATLYSDVNGDWHTYPKAAALKMFNLGAVGNKMTSVSVTKSTGANVNVYATGSATDLYVTIVNKTSLYNSDDVSAQTTVTPANFTSRHAYYIQMQSSSPGDVTATDATVGGQSVNKNNGAWAGAWSTVALNGNSATVTVPAAAAGVLHLTNY